MANVRKATVTVTTDGSGDAVARTNENLSGLVVAVIYDKTDFADGVDFDIVTDQTRQTLWSEDDVNASKTVRPVAPAQTTDGADSTLTELPIPIANEPVEITVANGGAAKVGTFTILVV